MLVLSFINKVWEGSDTNCPYTEQPLSNEFSSLKTFPIDGAKDLSLKGRAALGRSIPDPDSTMYEKGPV